MTISPFGVALAVILGAVIIISARHQIAVAIKWLYEEFDNRNRVNNFSRELSPFD